MVRTPDRDRLVFGRSDRIFLRVALVLVAVLTVASEIVLPIWSWTQGDPLRVRYQSGVTVPELAGSPVTASQADYTLGIPDPTTTQRLLSLVPDVLTAVIVLTSAWLVYRVLQDIAAGESFRRRNVTRLRAIALIVGIGGCTVGAVEALLNLPILEDVDLGVLPAAGVWTLPWLPLGVAMFVALIAEAFRSGADLQDDVEGLI